MPVNRRGFLKAALAGSVALLPDGVDAKSNNHRSEFDNSLGVLVDTSLCIGCRKCELACNKANGLPFKDEAEYNDKTVFEKHRRPEAAEYTAINRVDNPTNPNKPYHVKIQCMHCNEPACVSACLVGALTRTREGPVIYDPGKCMGCRYCMVSCPFQIPAYDYHNAFDPRVRKCGFCFERIISGKVPACVSACPNEALTFGRRGELVELARERIMQYPDRYVDHIYGEWEAGGTSWMYISAVDFDKTELPALDSSPAPRLTESIQHGIFKSFIPPLALFGVLALAMVTLRDRNKNKRDDNEIS